MRGQLSVEFFMVLSLILALAVILYAGTASQVSQARELDKSVLSKALVEGVAQAARQTWFEGNASSRSVDAFVPSGANCFYFNYSSRELYCFAPEGTVSAPAYAAVNASNCSTPLAPGWMHFEVYSDGARVWVNCSVRSAAAASVVPPAEGWESGSHLSLEGISSPVISTRAAVAALLVKDGAVSCDSSAVLLVSFNGSAPVEYAPVSCAAGRHEFEVDSAARGFYEVEALAGGLSATASFSSAGSRPVVTPDLPPVVAVLIALLAFACLERRKNWRAT
ncbi:hypothetical protein AUJ16_02935 [Candidatus Micrarchaeota archaeon CG1_02_60_51]|nr:MAG: hypothetical protein AUJ16_02935 [Candidatus Micrarchaeota archaeon CG1_02_60_51]